MVQDSNEARVQQTLAAMAGTPTAASVRTFLANADTSYGAGRISHVQATTIRQAGWRRLAELAGSDTDEPLARRWIEMIVAFEALSGKRASRTRPMLDRHGARRAFERLVDRTTGTSGFDQMIEAGMHDLTAEWIVLEFRGMFEKRICDLAEHRLAAAGIHDRPRTQRIPSSPP